MLILPFDAHPTIIELPGFSYDVDTKAGNFTLDGLRLQGGTQYIVLWAMDMVCSSLVRDVSQG
jgi:hypothetical protein